jgi:phage gp29-like protein
LNPTGQSAFNQARIEWAIRLRYSPMPELDMKWLAANLNAFRIGELRVVGKLWEVMMERDGELALNADKRCADLAGLEWKIASDGSPDGDKHAQALTYFYKHLTATHALDQDRIGGVSELLYHMASAHSYYYSAHEMLLRVDNAGANEVTAEFRHTPMWFFEARRGYLGYLQHIFDVYGQPCLQGEWLTCVSTGWMRPLSMAFALKAFATRDWATYNARYATGILEGISQANKTDPAWAEAVEVMQAIASDGVILHNDALKLQFLAQEGQRGQQAFEPMVERIDRLYAKCYRGVDLATSSRQSSPQGGGNAVGASVQAEESGIFLARDAVWSTGYLNRRVDTPIIRYLFGQEPRAGIAVMPPLADTTTEDLASVAALVPLGLRISLADAYKRFRWTAPEAGEVCLTAPVPIAPGNPDDPDAPGKPAAPKSPVAPPAKAAAPETPDESEADTQSAVVVDDSPIGAGAIPASVQTSAADMPDPQVDAAGFWSTAAASRRAIIGPLSKKPLLPTAAYAIPNAKEQGKISDAFEAASAKQLAAATHEDMSHAAAKVKALLQITDPAHFALRAKDVLAEWDDVTANTLLAPKAADVLAPIIGTAYAQGKETKQP